MKNSFLVLGILLILAAPLILISGTAYTLLLPNIYQSAARIHVQDSNPGAACPAPCEHCSAQSPDFIPLQIEIIQSTPILHEVISRLNLQAEWGRAGEKLPRNIAHIILKNSVHVSQQRDTSLLCISVKRDNPNEAAKIANEIAEVYRDSRLDLAYKEARAELQAVRDALQEQTERIEKAETLLRGFNTLDQSNKAVRYTQDELEAERLVSVQLKAKARMISLEEPRNPVEIIDIAEPNARPVSPNLFMNILLSLGVGALPFIAGIVLIVSGAKSRAPEL